MDPQRRRLPASCAAGRRTVATTRAPPPEVNENNLHNKLRVTHTHTRCNQLLRHESHTQTERARGRPFLLGSCHESSSSSIADKTCVFLSICRLYSAKIREHSHHARTVSLTSRGFSAFFADRLLAQNQNIGEQCRCDAKTSQCAITGLSKPDACMSTTEASHC